jgi:hypothetical protein
VNPAELAFGLVLVPVLVGLAGFFTWRQLRTLRSLRTGQHSVEERVYLRMQSYRRLACSALMVVLAGLLVGSFFLEAPQQQVLQERREQNAREPASDIQPEHRDFLRTFTVYWMVTLFVVFAMLMLVAADVYAIARFGARQHRRLREDFNSALAQEVARLRGGRNGQSDGRRN